MKKKVLYIAAVFGLVLTTACGNPKLKNGEEVVAKIDGKEYSANDLYEELKGQYGYNTIINWIDSEIANKEVETTDEIKDYVDEAIEYYQSYAKSYQMTLPQFAANYLGLNNINSEEDLRDFLTKDRKLTVAIQKQVASKIKDDEAKEYYDDNYKEVYNFKQIVVTGEDAEDTIKTIKKELKDAKNDELESTFDKMAEKYSADKDNVTKKNATKDSVDEKIWKELKDLDDKDYSGDISSNNNHYIVLRLSKGKASDFDDVKDEIKTKLAEKKLSSDQFLSYDVLIELRNKYKIAFFDKDLKDGYDDFKKQLEDAKKQASNSNSNSNEE